MPQTSENWTGLVKDCVFYARQTHDIYQVLPYSVDFRAPGSLEIHLVRKYLANVVLFGIKDMWTFEMTLKFNSNLYVGLVTICPNCDTY